MPKPSSFAVYLMLEGGHREEIKFSKLEEFQVWYSKVLIPNHDSNEFINVPLKMVQGEYKEYMVVRPSSIKAIRVEPIFTTSIDRDEVE
ncbi:hypothetical protein ACL6C3_03280 [Capilliphycus salinus ALCB114379]|uniref:hypothetical protein n=1 Tax=Capilliphycus salinus TaxID=2768948 RepID=UPI0039A54B41